MRTIRIALCLCAVLLGVSPVAHFAVGAQSNEAPASSAVKPPALTPDPVVAKGKGFVVKRSELDEALIPVKNTIAAQGRTLSREESSSVAKAVLDQIIQVRLLVSKASAEEQAEGRELGAKAFEQLKRKAGSEELLRQLKAAGTTETWLRARLSEQHTAEAVLVREFKVDVTDAEVKKFYDENPGKFVDVEGVRASCILISTHGTNQQLTFSAVPFSGRMTSQTAYEELSEAQKAAKRILAEEVLKRARAGEDFGKLAKDYSDDPGSKEKGGEYTLAPGQISPEFEAAAASMSTNQVSDLVTNKFGYLIFKVSDKTGLKKMALEKVARDIRQSQKAQKLQSLKGQLTGFLDKTRKEANVEILDENL